MKTFIYIYLIYLISIAIQTKETTLYAIVPLKNLPSSFSCPFMHQDSYANTISHLSNIVQEQIEIKIEGNNKCNTLFNTLSQNLNTIDLLFQQNKDPSLYQELEEDLYTKQLIQMKLNLLLKEPNHQNYTTIEKNILTLEEKLYATQLEKKFNQNLFTENKINNTLQQTYNHFNNILTGLTNTDGQCIDQLGGWQQILPTLLNSMSAMSGLSGYAYGAMIGASLKIISSLSILLKDISAKNALKDLIRHKNNKILACLYFTIQHTACEYKRSLMYSQKEDEVKKIIQQKHDNNQTKLYDKFFYMVEHAEDFEKIFFDIATMGSAITLDVQLITRYFKARKVSPETILNDNEIGQPPLYNENSETTDIKRQSWLIKVKNRGVVFNDRNFNGIKPLKDQVKEALADIAAKRADIESVERILTETRSFVDLKHELDTNPQLLKKTMTFRTYFQEILNGDIIHSEKKGLVASALRILIELEEFLSLSYNHYKESTTSNTKDDLDKSMINYEHEVNEKGNLLFKTMSSGAVAQISKQNILTIGSVVQDRIIRVFKLIEEEFLLKEIQDHKLNQHTNNTIKYSDYRRDRHLLIKVASNYLSFSANAKTFRSEDIGVAMASLEKSFRNEIYRMIKKSLNTSSIYYPSLKNETASHLCSLFSSTLKKSGFMNIRLRKIYKICKKRFSNLELIKIINSKKIKIAWDEPCFYSNYWRIITTQRYLYYKYLDIGFG